MSRDSDDGNKRTDAILDWCDRVDAIVEDEELSTLIRDTDVETLMAVYEHYDELLDDHRKLGNDEAPFSEWDQEVMNALLTALRERGLKPVPRELGEVVDEVIASLPGKTFH